MSVVSQEGLLCSAIMEIVLASSWLLGWYITENLTWAQHRLGQKARRIFTSSHEYILNSFYRTTERTLSRCALQKKQQQKKTKAHNCGLSPI